MKKPINQRIKALLLLASLVLVLGIGPSSAIYAQDPGGGGGGGGGSTGGGGGDPNSGGGGSTGGGRPPTGGGGGGGGSTVNTNSQQTNIDPSVSRLVTTPDTRNQGFVGSTATNLETLGFVGAASDRSGPRLVSGATFGGGVNRVNARSTARRPVAGGFNARTGAGFSPLGSQNGFQVSRSGTRSRLSLNFETPMIEGEQVVANFVNSYQNLPSTQSQSQAEGYQINIIDKTAVVTGWVSSQAEADRLISQLRLQPGVYNIDNQLQVGR
jgi:hypothetical protein